MTASQRRIMNTRVASFLLLGLLSFHHLVRAFLPRCSVPTSRSIILAPGEVACNAAKEGSSDSLDDVKRIFCISDLHTDSAINMRWLEAKCEPSKDSSTSTPGKGDLLIVAGDIAHELETLTRTLSVLKRLECKLFFIVGNHEAWMTSHCRSYLDNSIQKLEAVNEACQSMGVYTDHQLVGSTWSHPLWIVPIQGWYDGSLSIKGCEELCEGFSVWPWTDFSRCTWPQEFPIRDLNDENARIPKGLTEYFRGCNEPAIDAVRKSLLKQSKEKVTGVMSVSHFLPNQQSLPDWKDLNSPVFLRDEWLDHGAPQISAKFAKVAGSRLLDDQIRSIVPPGENARHLHVFGHSHRPKDFDFQGIRYVHNPLGKPREREMHLVSPEVGFQLLWDTSSGEVTGEQILRYWDEKGGGKDAMLERRRKRRENVKRVTESAVSANVKEGNSTRR